MLYSGSYIIFIQTTNLEIKGHLVLCYYYDMHNSQRALPVPTSARFFQRVPVPPSAIIVISYIHSMCPNMHSVRRELKIYIHYIDIPVMWHSTSIPNQTFPSARAKEDVSSVQQRGETHFSRWHQHRPAGKKGLVCHSCIYSICPLPSFM